MLGLTFLWAAPREKRFERSVKCSDGFIFICYKPRQTEDPNAALTKQSTFRQQLHDKTRTGERDMGDMATTVWTRRWVDEEKDTH